MIAAPDVVKMLANTVLFGGVSTAGLAQVAQEFHGRTFEPGQLIFGRGDPGHEIYIVIDGRVRLSILSVEGRSLAFSHATVGDIFGEIAALDGGVRTADATAISKVRAIVLGRASLKRLIVTEPEVATAAITFLCNRLRVTSEQLEQVALSPIEIRTARFLLHTLRLQRSPDGDTTVAIDIGMSQSELALLIGTSRQSVNTVLTAMERNGVFKRVGAQLECNVERLTALAGIE